MNSTPLLYSFKAIKKLAAQSYTATRFVVDILSAQYYIFSLLMMG